ncbi:hypothetical protein B0A48_05898 [Cryoendolithus antarcticus]|uniref:RING-type domain-containing protein n=1 Tax=Cryoendolithus antarcticus TaxID=1507870 RepID=A0A1V8TC98_9PEZI|nr:hypothetical protein B0A48_05898 [Cryoendolithus antarcticus]
MAAPLRTCQFFLNNEITPVICTTAPPTCPICDEPATDPVSLPCNHVFCRECITAWSIGPPEHNTCSMCRRELFHRSLIVRLPIPAAMQNAGTQTGADAEAALARARLEEALAARAARMINDRHRVLVAARVAREDADRRATTQGAEVPAVAASPQTRAAQANRLTQR